MRLPLLIIVILLVLAIPGCQAAPQEVQQQTGQEQPPAQGNGSVQEDYLDEALQITDVVEEKWGFVSCIVAIRIETIGKFIYTT